MTMLQAYKQETVIQHANTYDQWGERTEINSTVPAKIIHERKRVKDSKGEYVVSEVQLYLRKDVVVGESDMFTVDGDKRPIITIKEPRAFINAYGHMEIYL
jgi:hypothetical protein